MGNGIYFQKLDLLLDQVFEKLYESETLSVRSLLKEKYQDIGFKEA